MGKRTDTKAVQKSIAAAERRYKMLEYVKGGATNRDIAAMMDADQLDASPLLEVGAITKTLEPQ